MFIGGHINWLTSTLQRKKFRKNRIRENLQRKTRLSEKTKQKVHYNNKKTFFEDDIKFEYCVFGYLSWKSDSGQLYKAIAYLLGDDRKVHIIPCNSCAGSKLQSCRYIAKFSMAVRKCTVSSFFFTTTSVTPI